MQSVTVKKGWLLGVVTENREKHHEQYEKAFAGYRRDCIKCLEDNLAALKDGSRERVFITETAPEDHTKDYDRVIAMLSASVDTEIDLDASEFDNYVQDDWNWKQNWVTSNTKYLG